MFNLFLSGSVDGEMKSDINGYLIKIKMRKMYDFIATNMFLGVLYICLIFVTLRLVDIKKRSLN